MFLGPAGFSTPRRSLLSLSAGIRKRRSCCFGSRCEGVLVLKRVATIAFAGLLLAPNPVGAQYFGRNKVQYDRFEFRVLQTPHFDIHYYAEERDAVQQAARMAERWYARLSAVFDHTFDRRIPVIFYASHG